MQSISTPSRSTIPSTTFPSITGETVYIRFHGTAGRYSGNYTDKMLAYWAGWIKQNKKNVTGIYAYFNNDADAHAINDAKQLKNLLAGR